MCITVIFAYANTKAVGKTWTLLREALNCNECIPSEAVPTTATPNGYVSLSENPCYYCNNC